MTSGSPHAAGMATMWNTTICDVLVRQGLGDQLFLPNSTEYTATIKSYYSQDVSDVTPWCILKPETTQQVATAIKTLADKQGTGWGVAIRSGGHAPFASNNIEDGVTIDLGRLNCVTVNNGIASIGPGARWGEVFTTLETQGVMVAGGRETHVGVGGLLLGGGFSWYSGKRGLPADNVVAYEVILADGCVVTADATTHPDLFKALKGGMNNFGVVTRFDVQTFPSHDVYAGITAYSWAQRDAVLQTFTQMIDRNHAVPAEHAFLSISWCPGRPPSVAFIVANVDGDVDSPSFAHLQELKPLADLRETQSISQFMTSIQGTLGSYNVWYTLTFHNSIDMGSKVIKVFESMVAELQDQLDEAVQIIFVFVALPTTYANRGPNVLGLDEFLTSNSIVLQLEALLPSPKYEWFLDERLKAATDEIETYAKATGQDTPFRYVNYANQDQDPLSSYGTDNVNFLKTVAGKYDPGRFFQERVPGGFKL